MNIKNHFLLKPIRSYILLNISDKVLKDICINNISYTNAFKHLIILKNFKLIERKNKKYYLTEKGKLIYTYLKIITEKTK